MTGNTEVKISVARPEMIESLWNQVFPHLKPAIDEDFWTDEQTLKKMLAEDNALMFIASVNGTIKGVAVTQIEEMRSKVVNIITLGGEDFKDWKEAMNAALTLYAEKTGCSRIVALGRRGWEKLWPDFKPGKILFYKEIAA